MQTVRKSKPTSPIFSPEQIAAAKAAAAPCSGTNNIDWQNGTPTHGGGVAATINALRQSRKRGNAEPDQEQVAIRLDAAVVDAFRASGPDWEARINNALKEWLKTSG